MPPAEPAPRPSKLEAYQDPQYAADYDQRWQGQFGVQRDRRKAQAIQRAWADLQQASGEKAQSMLDIPCGTGRFATLFDRFCPTVVGADLAEPMLREARLKHPRSRLLAADGARLPFDDGAFDVVICIRFLHLIRDPELRVTFLREFRRVARLGVILDYRHGHTLRIWGRHLRFRMGLLHTAPANPSPSAIRAEIAAAGLKLVSRRQVHFGPWLSDKVLHTALS